MEEEKKKKKGWLVLFIIFLAALIICAFFLIKPYINLGSTSGTEQEETTAEITEPKLPETEARKDFDELQLQNPDIYAWIYIPGTPVDYPILQNPEDNYYLRRDAYTKKYSIKGCIFTEVVNKKDFTDRNTLIYGHSGISDHSFFTDLQLLSNVENFRKIRNIYIYTPKKEFVYEIIAVAPHNDEHLMYMYDWDSKEDYNGFFKELYSIIDTRALFLDGIKPDFDTDRLITLSTCLDGNSKNGRYLVFGRLVEEYNVKGAVDDD